MVSLGQEGYLEHTREIMEASKRLQKGMYPSEDWVQGQIPKVVLNGIKGGLTDEMEMDSEAVFKAYMNIVAGTCISLGLRFAGTKDGNAQDLLYSYVVAFLNEIKPLPVKILHGFPIGLSQYVDRGTVETCLHLIALSLSVVSKMSIRKDKTEGCG